MRVEFKCDECENEEERWIPYEEIEKQTCEKCGAKLRRLWGVGSIKTGDGTK
jgi:putative FmdB family regulatory protein